MFVADRTKLINLFLSLSPYVSGLSKGKEQISNLLKIVENLDNNESLKDKFMIKADGNVLYFSDLNWKNIEYALNSIHTVYNNNNSRRMELHDNVKNEMYIALASYLQYQTPLTTIMKLLPGDGANHLKQIFSEEFSNILYNDSNLDVSYNRLSIALGRNISMFFYDMILNNKHVFTSKNNFFVIRNKDYLWPDTCNEYFKDIVSYNLYEENNFKEISKVSEKQILLITLFTNYFKINRSLFNDEQLLVFIKLFNLLLLYNINAASLDNNNDTKTYLPYFNLFLEKKQITNFNENKLKVYHQAVKQHLLFHLDLCFLNLGKELIDCLEEKILTVSSYNISTIKRSPYTIRIIDQHFMKTLPSDLPSVHYITEQENVESILNEDNTTTKISYKRSKRSGVNNNYYIQGESKNQNIYTENQKNTRYTINNKFSIEFFSVLKKALEEINITFPLFRLILDYDDTFVFPKELDYIVNFVSQLYEINFMNLLTKSETKEQKKLILDILCYSLNFNNLGKFHIDEEIYTCLKKYYFYLKVIIQRIHSKKIMFNEIFYQTFIMSHFSSFFYNWFLDSRGRLYFLSILTLQNISLLRCIITFYEPTTIKIYANYLFRLDNPKKIELEKIEQYLLERTHNIMFSALTKHNENPNSEETLTETLKNIKIGHSFLYFVALLDYNLFLKMQKDHKFIHIIGKDARNSGLQMQAIDLRSYNLARFCNLVENSKNAYVDGEIIIRKQVKEILDFVANLKTSYDTVKENKQLLENISLPYGHIISKNLSDDDNSMSFDKLKLLEIYVEFSKNIQESPEILDMLINKKTIKVLCMTTPYGSTFRGCTQQMLEKIVDNFLKSGNWYNNEINKKIRPILNIVYKLFLSWMTKTLPESLLIKDLVKKITKSRKRIHWQFKEVFNKHFTFSMYPLKCQKFRYSIPGVIKKTKRRIMLKEPTNKIDWSKQALSFTANRTHSMDAYSLAETQCEIYQNNKTKPFIHFYTNHDCFYTTPLFIPKIQKIVKKAYLNFFDSQSLENLKNNPVLYNAIKKAMKNKRQLKREELCPNYTFLD